MICALDHLLGLPFESVWSLAGAELLLVQLGFLRLGGSWTTPSPKQPPAWVCTEPIPSPGELSALARRLHERKSSPFPC